MAKKSNFTYNAPRVKAYLDDKGFEYVEYNRGQHVKILGATASIELWPSRMKYKIIDAEYTIRNVYGQLSYYFNEKELDELLSKGE